MPEKQAKNNPDLSELITLKQAADAVELSYSHLRYLARRGDIWAVQLGRSWFTTLDAVHDYTSRPHKPGPKPQSEKPDSSIGS
jgi:hypothetical protein